MNALYKSYDLIKTKKRTENLIPQDDREPSPSKDFTNDTTGRFSTLGDFNPKDFGSVKALPAPNRRPGGTAYHEFLELNGIQTCKDWRNDNISPGPAEYPIQREFS